MILIPHARRGFTEVIQRLVRLRLPKTRLPHIGNRQTLLTVVRRNSRSLSPQEKIQLAVQVFDSNMFLDSRKARGCEVKAWALRARINLD